VKQFMHRHDVRCRLIRDSAGRPSWTCTVSIPILIAFTLRFLLGGFTFVLFGSKIMIPVWSAGEYAIACGVWLAMWAQRDFVGKRHHSFPQVPSPPSVLNRGESYVPDPK